MVRNGQKWMVEKWMDRLVDKVNLFKNPVGTMPTIWNDLNATDPLKSALLWDIKRAQSAGIQRMMDAWRSPRGDLPVSSFLWRDSICYWQYNLVSLPGGRLS
jgi:hypothetical protein